MVIDKNLIIHKQKLLIKYFTILSLIILTVELISIALGYFNINENIDMLYSITSKYINLDKYINIGGNIYTALYLINKLINILLIIMYNTIVILLLSISRLVLNNTNKINIIVSKIINTVALIILLIISLVIVLNDINSISIANNLDIIVSVIKVFRKIAEIFVYLLQSYIIIRYTYLKTNGGNEMRKSTLVIFTIILALLATGCSNESSGTYDKMSKSELISKINELNTDIALKENEVKKFKTMMGLSDGDNYGTPGVSIMNDGSGNLNFTTYDSKMIFPETFKFPGALEMSANPKISLSGVLELTPNQNWLSRIGGNCVELEHSSGISGIIKVGSQVGNDYISPDDLKVKVIGPWFEQVTNATVSYQDIFLDDKAWGAQADTSIYIDNEEAQLKCGMFYIGSYSVTYVFTYRSSERDSNKDEVINNIINSMKLTNLKVSVK